MKKILIAIFAITILLLVRPRFVFAQMGWGMMSGYYGDEASNSSQIEKKNQHTLQDMVNNLFKAQNISQVKDLNCSKVSKDQFEKLGDAWMDVQIPNKVAHEAMDSMMGGEGSQSLAAAHIQMAKRYLGCVSTSGSNYSWMSMMSSYQNGDYVNKFSMMGRGFGAFWFVTGIVVFVDLLLLSVLLWKEILN